MTVLDTTAPVLPAPGSTAGQADAAAAEPALRALRTALVEETLRLRRWQRLVQARLDLATDRLSPAEALRGAAVVEQESGEEALRACDAAGPADLVALVRGQVGGASDAVDDLRAVVATHRVLRARALDLAGRLAAVDASLARLGTAGPSTARRCCPRG